MSVGSDQHGRGSSDLAKDRELPHAIVPGVDQPDSIRPRLVGVDESKIADIEPRQAPPPDGIGTPTD